VDDGFGPCAISTLIEAYEARNHPIPAPDPIAAILFMMEQKGLIRRDLEPAIVGRSRVSEILNRRRPLTLPMVRALSLARYRIFRSMYLFNPYETRSAA
jgi:HTH-type transcriptional regulator / antitoxin HigA